MATRLHEFKIIYERDILFMHWQWDILPIDVVTMIVLHSRRFDTDFSNTHSLTLFLTRVSLQVSYNHHFNIWTHNYMAKPSNEKRICVPSEPTEKGRTAFNHIWIWILGCVNNNNQNKKKMPVSIW